MIRTRLAVCVFASAALSLSVGCVFDSGFGTEPEPPRGISVPPVEAQLLQLGRPTRGKIDCAAGECVRRYELDLHSHGQLSIRIEPDVEQSGDGVRAILEDPAGNVIGREISDESGRSFSVGGPAQPGRYSLSLQSRSGQLDYRVIASLDQHGPQRATQLERDVAQANPDYQRPRGMPSKAAPSAAQTAAETAGAEANAQPAQTGPGSIKNPKTNFAAYRSFAFGDNPEKRLSAPPGAYVGNPFIDREIQRAIRYQLADRGYEETSIDQAQFLVTAHTGSSSSAYYTISGVVYSNAYSSWFDSWGGIGGVYGGSVRSYIHTEGTLVIDVIDIASTDLVWHGWTTKTTGWVDDEIVIKEAVQEILAQFGN